LLENFNFDVSKLKNTSFPTLTSKLNSLSDHIQQHDFQERKKITFQYKYLLVPLQNMESTRQQKIARLIQQDMSEIFQKETKSIFGNSMITVTRVRISPDLSIARILVSIFPIGGDSKDEVMNKIQENIPDLRRRLGYRVGKQLRIIPNLFFYLDDSLDYIENIENLLKQ
jgi:ribosome-binding factor A